MNYYEFSQYFPCLMTSSISIAVTAVAFLYGFNAWTVAISRKVLKFQETSDKATDCVSEKRIYRIRKYTRIYVQKLVTRF